MHFTLVNCKKGFTSQKITKWYIYTWSQLCT